MPVSRAGLLAAPVLVLLAVGGSLTSPLPAAALPPAAPIAAPGPPTASPGTGTLLFAFADVRIGESSGLAADSSTDAVLWTHNDSGDTSRAFAVGPTGRTLAVVLLPGTAVDVEDMAVGPGPTGPFLYLADIGDNTATRTSVEVRRVPEPVVDLAAPTFVRMPAPAPQTETMTYEDGPHDAEALLVHPRTGQLLVVTKDLLGAAVYEAPPGFADGVLHRRGPVPTRLTGTPGGPGIGDVAQLLVTGGSVSKDGRRIALRTYTDAYLYEVPGDDMVAALRSTPVVVPLPETRQGEGVTWTRDGTALLTSSEGKGAPVYRVPVPAVSGSAPTITAPTRGVAARHTAHRRRSRSAVTYVTVALGLLGVIFAVTRSVRRRGRE